MGVCSMCCISRMYFRGGRASLWGEVGVLEGTAFFAHTQEHARIFYRKKAKIIYLPDNTLLLRVYYEYICQLPITDKILQYKNKKRVQTFVQTPYRIFLLWCIHQLISSIFLIGLIASCATCLSTKISPVSLRRQS